MLFLVPMKRTTLLFAALALAATASFADTAQGPVQKKQMLSKVYNITKIYKSMEGPYELQQVYLGDRNKPELLWVTSIRTDIVQEDGHTPANSQFMCHMNVDINPATHSALLGEQHTPTMRLFTLSQGVFSANLPAGFGFPIISSEPLSINTQVLNHNVHNPKNIRIRHKVTIEYIRDADLKTPMRAVTPAAASGMVMLGEGKKENPIALIDSMGGSMGSMKGSEHGPSCLVAPRAPNSSAGADYVDPQGHKMTGHWVVPPGHQVNHSDVSWFLGLPYDTKIHYAVVHLHPFATSLTLRDATENRDIWTAKASGPEKGIGLAHVDTLTSVEGIPLYKNHKYELISVYDNPTKTNADSMASMFFAVEDPEFRKPEPEELAMRAGDLLDNASAVIFRTSAGDVAVTLFRDRAPGTVKQFARLVRKGVYNNVRIGRVAGDAIMVEAKLPAEMQKYVRDIGVEQSAHDDSGVLSICPGETSFSILLKPDPSRDGKCTAFGRIGPGAGVIRNIVDAPKDADGRTTTVVEVLKTELYDPSEQHSLDLAPPKPIAMR